MIAKTRHRIARAALLLAPLPLTLTGCGAEAAVEETPGISTEAVCSAVTLSTSVASPRIVGNPITLTANASCNQSTVEYQFSYRASGAASWVELQPFGSANSVPWVTSGLAAGSYQLRVRARNPGSTAVESRLNFVLGTASPCSGAVLVPNQTYGTYAANLLDLHLPTGFTGARPLIVWIHGGRWTSGSKVLETAARNKLCPLITQGFAVASVDYRLTCIPPECPNADPPTCEDAIFPAQIHDVKAAVRFLRARAGNFSLAPNRIVSWGASAGGHLSALLGTSANVPFLEDFTQGNETFSSRVQGFIDCYGPTQFDTMDTELGVNPASPSSHTSACSAESQLLGCNEGLQHEDCATQLVDVSPLTHVGPGDPPALVSHGTADPAVPFEQSEHLVDALQDEGNPVTWVPKSGAHDIAASCPSNAEVEAFLAGLFP